MLLNLNLVRKLYASFNNSPHQNKKGLSSFYQKKIFDKK